VVCSFVGSTTVGVADQWMGAGWAILVCRDGAWMVFHLVGLRTDSVACGVPPQGGWMSIALAVAVLNVSSV